MASGWYLHAHVSLTMRTADTCRFCLVTLERGYIECIQLRKEPKDKYLDFFDPTGQASGFTAGIFWSFSLCTLLLGRRCHKMEVSRHVCWRRIVWGLLVLSSI